MEGNIRQSEPAGRSLAGSTLLVSGGSRGIGLAIAVRAASDGARVALMSKTTEPHPRLQGTIHTAAEAVRQAGGEALPLATDVRDEEAVRSAIEATLERFGGIDILVNNASAIDLSLTEKLEMRRFDLMHAVNVRATFLVSKLAIPHLREGVNPHILTLSPPLDLAPRWLAAHLGYTLSKYAMSLATIGLAEELRDAGIAANSLWPRTIIGTDAIGNQPGGSELLERARRPEIVAEAAYMILTRPAMACSGNLFLDENVLREEGIDDFSRFENRSGKPPMADLFVGSAGLTKG